MILNLYPIAVIRECFPTSILLGSITSPVQPKPTCTPEPVESDSIQVHAESILDILQHRVFPWFLTAQLCRLASARKTCAQESEVMETLAPTSLPRRGRWTPSTSSTKTRRTPCSTLTKLRILIRTISRPDLARLPLNSCQSLCVGLLPPTDPPREELKTAQDQRTRLDRGNLTRVGLNLSQQEAIQAACDATSAAPCSGDQSATQSALTLTRVIPNRPTTASRARLVSGKHSFSRILVLFLTISGILGNSLPVRLPTSGSASTLQFSSAPSTTLCFQRQLANLRTSQRVESLESRPASASLTFAMPTGEEVQPSLKRATGEKCRGLSHRNFRTDV